MFLTRVGITYRHIVLMTDCLSFDKVALNSTQSYRDAMILSDLWFWNCRWDDKGSNCWLGPDISRSSVKQHVRIHFSCQFHNLHDSECRLWNWQRNCTRHVLQTVATVQTGIRQARRLRRGRVRSFQEVIRFLLKFSGARGLLEVEG